MYLVNDWEFDLEIFSLSSIIFYLFNKTRHSYIYIYVAYSRPNVWTDWAEFFCGHSWVYIYLHYINLRKKITAKMKKRATVVYNFSLSTIFKNFQLKYIISHKYCIKFPQTIRSHLKKKKNEKKRKRICIITLFVFSYSYSCPNG